MGVVASSLLNPRANQAMQPVSQLVSTRSPSCNPATPPSYLFSNSLCSSFRAIGICSLCANTMLLRKCDRNDGRIQATPTAYVSTTKMMTLQPRVYRAHSLRYCFCPPMSLRRTAHTAAQGNCPNASSKQIKPSCVPAFHVYPATLHTFDI